MRPWLAGGVLAILLVSGCAGLLGPDPATLPPEGEPFTVIGRGCGLQFVEHGTVWVTYPDRTLLHLVVAVESNRTDEDGREDPEDRHAGDVNVSTEEAIRVLAQAEATGAFDLHHYQEASRENGFEHLDLWHAEREQLDPDAFDEPRRRVTRAELDARDGARYTQPHGVSDGCSIDLAAWTGDGYGHVFRTSMHGPEAVQTLDEEHDVLHPPT